MSIDGRNKVKIDRFNNAYGIKGLNLKGLNNELFNMCIYASNGIFKSSFSRAMFNLTENNGEEIKDRIKDKKFEYDIKLEGENYKSDDNKIIPNLIVYSKELYEDITVDRHKGFEQLLLLPEYQKQLTSIDKELQSYITEFINNAKEYNIGIKSAADIANLVDSDITSNAIILKNIYSKLLKTQTLELDYIDFKKIDQKAYDIIDSKKFKNEVEKYTNIVQRKLSSKLFDEKFNDTNYDTLISALEETNFLNKNRYIIISDEKIDSILKFKEIIKNELIKIKSDPEVVVQYKNVLKTLGSAKEAKVVEGLLKDDSKVSELALGRKDLKISKIRKKYSDDELKVRFDIVKKLEERIAEIIALSKSQTSSFEEAIKIYTSRFKPKFEIRIENLYEARLGYEVPNMVFVHEDNKNKAYSELEIYRLLSSGERNALKTIHLIVKYEAIKDSNPTIILDDVVETFDYANRTAFLMYINEIKEKGSNIILLTHNFDFYRVAISRIGLEPAEAFIDKNGLVVIRINKRFQLSYDKIKSITSDIDLFSSIPFVREICAMCLGEENNQEFLFYTRLLHIKKGSKDIKISEVLDKIKNMIPNVDITKYEGDKNRSFVAALIDYEFGNSVESNDLKAKLAIAMSTRLKLEDKIIENDYTRIEDCNTQQTSFLFKKFKDRLTHETRVTFEKVLLNTPEFIHFNSFMYEPLIDIDPKDLLIVHEEVEKLSEVFQTV